MSVSCCAAGKGRLKLTHLPDAQFATSSFGEHTLVGTIAVVTGIMAGVCQPFIAKMADLFSRPVALTISVFCYTLGYIIIASAGNIKSVVAGQVIAQLGQTGIYQIQGILIADITNLKWRGFVSGLYSLPFILNAFIAGYITSGINGLSQNGWRWGYGMFCILIPVCLIPSLIVLFWGDRRAKKLGGELKGAREGSSSHPSPLSRFVNPRPQGDHGAPRANPPHGCPEHCSPPQPH